MVALLGELIRHCDRIPLGARFHLIAGDVDIDAPSLPVDALDRERRELHVLARQPVPRRHDEIADVPVYVISEQVFDMPEIAVRGVDVAAFDGDDALEARVLPIARLALYLERGRSARGCSLGVEKCRAPRWIPAIILVQANLHLIRDRFVLAGLRTCFD